MNSKMREGDGNTALPQMKSCLCIEILAVQKKDRTARVEAIYKRFFEKPSNFGLNHMGVSKNKGTTKWMVFFNILENPYFFMDDLGRKKPYFWKHTQGSQGEPLIGKPCLP